MPIGNDNGGYLKEYPHQSKLDNYAKDQRNKVWRQGRALLAPGSADRIRHVASLLGGLHHHYCRI
jgi:hypothetical protein